MTNTTGNNDTKGTLPEREDLILMLAHDMKNPLTAAIGSIDIIREECLGAVCDDQKEYLQSAIDSCNEVVMMIDNLLDVRRFEAGKNSLVHRRYNAHILVSTLAEQCARQAKQDGIDFVLDLEPGSAEISVDKRAFTRVMGNLFGNALKFTPEGGRIALSVHGISGNMVQELKIPEYVLIPPGFLDQNCFVRLSIRDTGTGIPYTELEQVFDRHARVARKSPRNSGAAGLGLAYCKLVVDSFHGLIWVESEAGLGCKFVVMLPVFSDSSSI
jgi:signal transduction histidine kinase